MTLPRVTVGGVVTVPRSLLTEEELEGARKSLSLPNPAHVAAVSRGAPAWRLPETVTSLVETDDAVIFPLAAASAYRPLLREKRFELADERPAFESQPVTFTAKLFPFQRRALDALLAHSTGGVVAPCGAGKGVILVATVAKLGVPTLVLVNSADQARELRDRLLALTGIDAGIIGDGVADVRAVTVALVQSLDEAMLARIADSFGALIVDEAHHAASTSYRAVCNSLHVRARYWFTATPEREDGLTAFIAHHLGPVRCEITRAELRAAGRSVDPTFAKVVTSFAFDYTDRKSWNPMLTAMVADAERNALIADTVAIHAPGHVSAVLTGRLDHAEVLSGMLEARGLRAFALTSATKKNDRARIIEDARASRLDVVCATQLADEGLDIASLSRVFLVFPAVAKGRLVQRVGRALRVVEGKPAPVVFDFVDSKVGVLAHQARVRAGIFAREFPRSLPLPPVAA